jgi:hypothetical protein
LKIDAGSAILLLPFNFFLLPWLLPAWFAVVAAGTPITIAIAAATATAAAATITTTTAAVTATVATATVATAPTIRPRPSFIDGQIAAVKVLAVELLDCRRCFFRRSHLDEAEASRATCHPIFDDLGRLNRAGLREMIAQVVAGCLKGEISYVQFCSHFFFCPCPLVQKEARNSITESKAGITDFSFGERRRPDALTKSESGS